MTFYLKYRPQTFEELDSSEVRESLKKTVSGNSLPHAFLFFGPKGTGKTSAARILAKAINCENRGKTIEPCNKCPSCISITKGNSVDVVELDAASHRGIDDIRSLREAAKLAPTSSKMKIYIIDEAHMLTTEAANALLKTLEEPPNHVIFILATTNPEKLIPTIRSRTTSISFAKATTEEFVRALSKVAKAEKVKIDSDALEEISKFSDGSFRDAVKILEQLVSEEIELKPDIIREKLSGISGFDEDAFIGFLSERDLGSMFTILQQVILTGASAKNITNALIRKLRQIIIGEGEFSKDIKIDRVSAANLVQKLIDSLHDIPVATLEQIPLELVLADWCLSDEETIEFKSEKLPDSDEVSKERVSKKTNKVGDVVVPASVSQTKKKDEIGELSQTTLNTSNTIPNDVWITTLSAIRQKNASTEALLRAAKPVSFDGKSVTLAVYYSFHKEKLESNPHRLLLEDTISSLMGSNVRISCILTEPPAKNIPASTVVEITSATTEQKKSDVILTEEKDDDIVKIAEKIFN